MLWVINYITLSGIIELILTAPELVDADLVGEMEQMVSKCVPASPQDTSHACLVLSVSVATALFYYKTGKVHWEAV